MMTYSGKLGIQQRVLPTYRKPFFDLLARNCEKGAYVASGLPLHGEGINTTESLDVAGYTKLKNRNVSNPSTVFYFCIQSGLLNWLEDIHPDALIIEANPRNINNRKAIKWMHDRERPVIGWGLGAPKLKGIFANIRDRERESFLKSIDSLIAYSRRGAEEYRGLGIQSEKVFVATNAVVSRPTSPLKIKAVELNTRANLLFVGRLQERKRLDNLFHACAKLSEYIQPVITIIGDGSARTQLVKESEKIYPSAIFIGSKYGEELEPFYESADIFVVPGTGGLAIQQAMAHGLPIVVAEGDGTHEDLVKKENGWVIPANDIESLSNILKEALSDVIRLRKMGEESHRLVRDEINIDSMVDVFIQALEYTTHQRQLK
jgi:glycosyltransferase involved in cell wall biosynthesis